jgi:hypothetical protein
MTNLSQLKLRMSRKRLDAELQILKCIISDDICKLFVVVDNSKIAKTSCFKNCSGIDSIYYTR